jgi:putative oxidoreductase
MHQDQDPEWFWLAEHQGLIAMASVGHRVMTRIRRFDAAFARIPENAVMLFVRIVAAQIFWASGRSKVDGWFSMRPEIVDLFRDEYALPLIPPEIAAPMATVAEHALPILLVIGLFTRFGALGLVVMTLVIQFFVYPDAWWPQHSLWMALLLVILWRGAGGWSFDRFVLPSGR